MFCNIYLWFNLSAASFFLCVFVFHSVLLLVNSTLVIFVVPYEYSFCLLVKGINLLGWFPLRCTTNLSHDLLLTFLFLSFSLSSLSFFPSPAHSFLPQTPGHFTFCFFESWSQFLANSCDCDSGICESQLFSHFFLFSCLLPLWKSLFVVLWTEHQNWKPFFNSYFLFWTKEIKFFWSHFKWRNSSWKISLHLWSLFSYFYTLSLFVSFLVSCFCTFGLRLCPSLSHFTLYILFIALNDYSVVCSSCWISWYIYLLVLLLSWNVFDNSSFYKVHALSVYCVHDMSTVFLILLLWNVFPVWILCFEQQFCLSFLVLWLQLSFPFWFLDLSCR